MTQHHHPLLGATWMLSAGLCFAIVNCAAQWLSAYNSLSSTTITLIQYLIALILTLPYIARLGIRQTLSTKNFSWHVFRVFLSAIGIQLWMWSLAYPVPIWQAIALLMTSPLFTTIGSGLFLRESVGIERWIATLSGFGGILVILEPWSDNFTLASLLPIGAAFFWACYALIVKRLSVEESSSSMLVYLLILITPFNLVLAIPEWQMPSGWAVWGLLVCAGIGTALAQWSIVKAYAAADASYIQPFDLAKLPLNIIGGWLIFDSIPPGRLWVGATIIIASVTLLTHWETRKMRKNSPQYKKLTRSTA